MVSRDGKHFIILHFVILLFIVVAKMYGLVTFQCLLYLTQFLTAALNSCLVWQTRICLNMPYSHTWKIIIV